MIARVVTREGCSSAASIWGRAIHPAKMARPKPPSGNRTFDARWSIHSNAVTVARAGPWANGCQEAHRLNDSTVGRPRSQHAAPAVTVAAGLDQPAQCRSNETGISSSDIADARAASESKRKNAR